MTRSELAIIILVFKRYQIIKKLGAVGNLKIITFGTLTTNNPRRRPSAKFFRNSINNNSIEQSHLQKDNLRSGLQKRCNTGSDYFECIEARHYCSPRPCAISEVNKSVHIPKLVSSSRACVGCVYDKVFVEAVLLQSTPVFVHCTLWYRRVFGLCWGLDQLCDDASM